MGLLLPAFARFKSEAELIGRMLAGYGELELDLMNCVQVIRLDLDAVLKAMFRVRGEEQRLKLADALGRPKYHKLKLGTQFEMAVGAIKHCLSIRNQYAHCHWYDDNTGRLAFVNLEELAKENRPVKDLKGLTRHYVDVPLLKDQIGYFEYAQDWLFWLNYEGRVRKRKLNKNPYDQAPRQRKPPALHRK